GHIAAVGCTYLVAVGLNKYTERTVTIATCLVGVLSGVAAIFVKDLASLMVLAILLGSATSSMGAMCNVLVLEGTPVPLQGRTLSGLHMMYGIGSIFAASAVAE